MTTGPLQVFDCTLSGVSLIEASAGTGKTWNICALYMRLLLQRGLEVPQILVVTFTNAATAELRERIRSRIAGTLARLRGGEADDGDEFVERLLLTLRSQHGLDDEDMKRRLDHALQTFDEAAIFTIHGFCERALRDTPFGAGMPLSMEFVTDDEALRLEVACDFWRRSVAAGDLPAGLAGVLIGHQDTPEKFARLLQRHVARPLSTELWPAGIDAPVSVDTNALQRAHDAARACWRRERDTIIGRVTEVLPRLHGGIYKPHTLATAAASWDVLLAGGDPLEAQDGLEKLDLLTSRRLQPKKGQAPPAHHEFFDLAEVLLEQRAVARAALEAGRTQLLYRLLRDGAPALRNAKLARRAMNFDDLLYNLYERLTGGHHPWLAGHLQKRFPAALIDEFQDTDPLQFRIFRTIYGSADAVLFLVGDPKQAIYSFRSADLHVYLRARREATRIYTLAENQRCTQELLRGLNALFGARERIFMLDGLDYIPLVYGRRPRKLLVDQTLARAPLQLWTLPRAADGEPQSKPEARERSASACAAEIARLMAGSEHGLITLDGAKLSAGHIAVLVRTHNEGRIMREALAAFGVGSVELSQDSLFASAEARDLERVLASILEPTRAPLLRAALATVLMGGTAARIEALSGDDGTLLDWMARFADYRDAWLGHGIGVMLRRLGVQQKIAERLLSLPLGERRLTNFLHLGELLQGADVRPASPDVVLRWLQARIAQGTHDDAAQLRLENDRRLVQIITIHKAKGLEYPLVFCPFLWDGHAGAANGCADGREYHDDDGNLVVDFRMLSEEDAIDVHRRQAQDRLAERMRLVYVALTRAVHRCYVVVGSYARRTAHGASTRESGNAPLQRLVADPGLQPVQIEAAWSGLAQRAAPDIGISPLPAAPGVPLALPRVPPEAITIADPPSHIPSGWRLGSYSQLIHGASGETAAVDHDLRAMQTQAADTGVPDTVPAEDIVRFPRGLTAGHCIHAVFENADFTRPQGWNAAIAAALRAYPQVPRQGQSAAQLPGMLANMLRDVLHTPLPGGIRLAKLSPERRLVELKFSLPVSRITHQGLKRLLAQHGVPMPALNFPALQGYLNGAIDLVFEAAGRYWLADWKGNYLGATAVHYDAQAMRRAMDEHHYHLQYLLYTVALHRYLQRRVPGFDYDTHVGGVLYLFVRGVRPAWTGADGAAAGVYAHRPPKALVEQLSALMAPARDAA
ncbi:MAG: exodeoxyribonuclease V subunit beta [Steroidobacterales bacterium]